jgi:hypothetical protein
MNHFKTLKQASNHIQLVCAPRTQIRDSQSDSDSGTARQHTMIGIKDAHIQLHFSQKEPLSREHNTNHCAAQARPARDSILRQAVQLPVVPPRWPRFPFKTPGCLGENASAKTFVPAARETVSATQNWAEPATSNTQSQLPIRGRPNSHKLVAVDVARQDEARQKVKALLRGSPKWKLWDPVQPSERESDEREALQEQSHMSHAQQTGQADQQHTHTRRS